MREERGLFLMIACTRQKEASLTAIEIIRKLACRMISPGVSRCQPIRIFPPFLFVKKRSARRGMSDKVVN